MLFWWICEGESVLPVLLLHHLGSSSTSYFYLAKRYAVFTFSVSVVSEDSISTSVLFLPAGVFRFPYTASFFFFFFFIDRFLNRVWAFHSFSCDPLHYEETLLMFGQVWVEETRSIISLFGLSCLVSLTPWTMIFTSSPQLFSSLLWRWMSRGFEVW